MYETLTPREATDQQVGDQSRVAIARLWQSTLAMISGVCLALAGKGKADDDSIRLCGRHSCSAHAITSTSRQYHPYIHHPHARRSCLGSSMGIDAHHERYRNDSRRHGKAESERARKEGMASSRGSLIVGQLSYIRSGGAQAIGPYQLNVDGSDVVWGICGT